MFRRLLTSFFARTSTSRQTEIRAQIAPVRLAAWEQRKESELAKKTSSLVNQFVRAYATSKKLIQSKNTKTKIKGYSSWKQRFSVTATGLFLRKQKGKRHMGFSKTPKQRRQLRASVLVHKSLERPMRKLGAANMNL